MTTISDKELLDPAAKAAGYKYKRHSEGLLIDGSYVVWNPLTDDGDAFRLMVKLEIAINPYAGKVVTWSEANKMAATEKWDTDDEATEAVRYAIVKAAAQIGKTL